ncbi:NAD-dependent epimerase/dehydratase family protein [Lentzea flaviverrucosa]|uniref:Nucleoside-diphosphate-sugar epimerase n=1 Tax=Lentzea flaviverrucosa TaxID=200379 RepID=A0A1H9XF08_9PSEU|nr:NAD-dependent epimerase/dehydratase family protein [Lentzea flaviverrucosa]RDI21462.1 nucleoside-diphosphate-sugar epimerase [Lentzea flaviverrucosa]SES44760.1 Nucleoside-diphosphate-sugar epimerase [Lentzea flaviverrucosa]
MVEHVVIGAGSIGSNVARLLVERGHNVRIITRSGSGPEHPLIDRVAADASDPSSLTELSRGAQAIYHCANPPSYTEWERLLPPLQAAAIAAAKANDAVLALTGSMYAYGPQPGGLMTERTPMAATGHKGRLRKRMWEQALAAGIRTVEVRGSDYIGRGANGIYSLLVEPALTKGKAAWITGHLDMPHTFTVNTDMAQALVTLASEERAWGRAWHVPSPPAITIRELAGRYATAAGRPPIKLIQLPRFVMRAAGLVVPIAREMAEMDYQWYAPFHMDATETAGTFGLTPTDLDTAVRDEVS